MTSDEEGAHFRLLTHRREVIEPKVREHRCQIVKHTGDGALAEFGSVIDAVRCALEVQQLMLTRNAGVSEGLRIEFRMGVNLGDVIIAPDDIYGHHDFKVSTLWFMRCQAGINTSSSAFASFRPPVSSLR